MATRPIFRPNISGSCMVETILVEFEWHPGISTKQKQLNITEIHKAGEKMGVKPILEVSSKSLQQIGRSLSAFNLNFETYSLGKVCVEAAYQGSKVFEYGGPYTDLYCKTGWDAKKDIRLKNSGNLIYFLFENTKWDLNPTTAFYDWLYINALNKNKKYCNMLSNFNGFTDIEFNPKKSFNCQARSCALYVALEKKGIVEDALADKKLFINLLMEDSMKNILNLFR